MRVAPNLEWHAACLKCAECDQYLDESCTCFVRNDKTYCKRDYTKLFGAKCNKCGSGFNKNDFVMRANDKIYHIDCFRCETCCRQLIPGDEFALRDNKLFCKDDHDVFVGNDVLGGNHDPHNFASPGAPLVMSPTSMNGVPHQMRTHSGVGVSTSRNVGNSGSSQKRKDAKTTRVRTVLNEKQLLTLRTCYAANCRPDALMKEQLTEMTGLSPRVIRVWFQNKRCKDKKRSIALKQMQEQQAKQSSGDQNGNSVGSQAVNGMSGIPMVASEPVKNEPPNPKPIDVQNYQQPAWKALSDFALQSEIEQPAFQHLMTNFSDHGQGSMSDSSEICSIPSVSSSGVDISASCSTPLAMPPQAEANSASACS